MTSLSSTAPVGSGAGVGGADGRRGAFILLEGVDRCGKTTQGNLLLDNLRKHGVEAEFFRFPNRGTAIGKMINSYLQSESELDDRCVHLLFSANSARIEECLSAGTTIVCDRYAYSGVAFSGSKKGLTLDWCMQPDVGLPAPDAVLFLDIAVEDAMKRGQFGEERYEKEGFQREVRANFLRLRDRDEEARDAGGAGVPVWCLIDAMGSVEEVGEQVLRVARETVETVKTAEGAPLKRLWLPKE